MVNKKKCKHRKIKTIYTHGYNSHGYFVCKDCGSVLAYDDLEKRRFKDKGRKK